MPDDCQTTEVIWSSLVVDNAPLLNASLSVGGLVHRLTGTVPDSGTGTPVVLPYYFLEIIQVIRIIKYIIRIIHNTRAKSVYYPTLLDSAQAAAQRTNMLHAYRTAPARSHLRLERVQRGRGRQPEPADTHCHSTQLAGEARGPGHLYRRPALNL